MAPKLFYAAGPGDVVGTYGYWRAGMEDPSETSRTYSGEFFDVCREIGADALIISSHPSNQTVCGDFITIEHRPRPGGTWRGLQWHIRELRYWLGLIWSAWRSGAHFALICDCNHWWMLWLLAISGVQVVPDLHCTLWPHGRRSMVLSQRLTHWLNGTFFRWGAAATFCISPECERQLRELAPALRGPVLQTRTSYLRSTFAAIAPPLFPTGPFRVLFAGRVEWEKGLREVIEVAAELQRSSLKVTFEVCGSGSAMEDFCREITRRGLDPIVTVLGKLGRSQMRDAYARAHLVLVPTTASFAEGLNRVAVESVLAGRPAIVTTVCPAAEVLGDAVIAVEPGDVPAMITAITQLATDERKYAEAVALCSAGAEQFYDSKTSWGAALRRALAHVGVADISSASIESEPVSG